MTKHGVLFTCAMAIMAVIAFPLDNQMLMVTGLTGITYVALTKLLLGRFPSVRIVVSDIDAQVTVGTTASVTFTIESDRRSFFVKQISVLVLPLDEVVARLARHPGAHQLSLPVPTHRRGIITVPRVAAIYSDPWKLFAKTVADRAGFEVAIVPKIAPVSLSELGNLLESHAAAPAFGTDELYKIREYVWGDEVRRIHWRSTARTGQVMVREYVSPPQSESVRVVLDNRRHAYSSAEVDADFETAIETLAGVLERLLTSGRRVQVMTASGHLLLPEGPIPSMKCVLRALAPIDRESCSDETFESTLRTQRSAILVVSGSPQSHRFATPARHITHVAAAC
jgi:uncharacterized protein (DUF58 family)